MGGQGVAVRLALPLPRVLACPGAAGPSKPARQTPRGPRRAALRAEQEPGGSSPAPRPSLFPAGKRQARVVLPALLITLRADEFQASPAAARDLAAAVAGGATAVALREGAKTGAAELYAAAVAVKELLRGRVPLLVVDRTDIADAAGADGALLSPAGLPTVVAKKALQEGASLVGRAVFDPDDAVAAAADGASFVLLQPGVCQPCR